MSKYVISDLHGCYDKFSEMLKLIHFNSNDELYIIGDIFDRGENPLGILDYVLANKNVYLIKGNHEKLFEEYFESGYASLWYINGGQTTHKQIIERGSAFEQQLYDYIKKLPLYKIVDNYLLVHSGINISDYNNNIPLENILKDLEKDDYMFLWDRSNLGKDFKYRKYKLIVGHTPVQTMFQGKRTIVNMRNTYYIDCGAVFHCGRLACLRLDDMKEFYVN